MTETTTQPKRAPLVRARARMIAIADPLGLLFTEGFHLIGLFAIGAATVWSAGVTFAEMMQKGHTTIEDLLLLFIYLEIGSMVGIYFRTNHMPVRFLLYVGITALTRHLIAVVQEHPTPDMGVLILAAATLILAFAVFVVRYTSHRYPSTSGESLTRANLGDR